jgi:predicted outer membrane repeat protein
VVTEAEIAIDNDVVLDGEGDLTVDGNDSHVVFSVAKTVTSELRGFTVTGGVIDGGIVILDDGTLTLTKSTVLGNSSEFGGGINSYGTLMLTNSTVSGNTAGTFGGGISAGGETTLVNSTISGNTAGTFGGGISAGGETTLVNSTISGNSALDGGGINNCAPFGPTPGAGRLTLINSTVSGNSASGEGGGIYDCLGEMILVSSTVADNATGEGDDITRGEGALTVTNSLLEGGCADFPQSAPDVTSNGYNIESPGDTCGFDQPTDQVNVSAGALALGPLQDNGGPTMTHALLPGSVAIDVIPEAECLDANGEPLTTDQRGEPRPEVGGTMCDVGAFEVQPPAAEGCTQSGGTVWTGLCCQAVESFPNTCTIGACGCAPDASHAVAICICPTNTCFDGENCVAQ